MTTMGAGRIVAQGVQLAGYKNQNQDATASRESLRMADTCPFYTIVSVNRVSAHKLAW